MGVRGREPPEKFLGATPFRSSENAPFGLKLAELTKQVLATYPSEKACSSTVALSFGWQAARVLHVHWPSFYLGPRKRKHFAMIINFLVQLLELEHPSVHCYLNSSVCVSQDPLH